MDLELVKKVLIELGYIQSSMDPCLFKLVVGEKLEGLVIVEVDDILSLGTGRHYERMEKLQQRFKFGKFKFLDEQPEGAAFNGRRMRVTEDGMEASWWIWRSSFQRGLKKFRWTKKG